MLCLRNSTERAPTDDQWSQPWIPTPGLNASRRAVLCSYMFTDYLLVYLHMLNSVYQSHGTTSKCAMFARAC